MSITVFSASAFPRRSVTIDIVVASSCWWMILALVSIGLDTVHEKVLIFFIQIIP